MRTKPLNPRESAKLISTKSKDVSICEKGVEEASKILFDCFKSKKYSFKIWKSHQLHPNEMTHETVDWIAVLDTLNFSFWTDEDVEPWTVHYEGKNYTGYWALCASINRALKVGRKYFWTVLDKCVVSGSSITFIQFCESPVVCIFAFLCMRVVMEDTVYFYAFLRALAVWPFRVSRGMRVNRGPEAPTSHVLLIYSPPFTPTSSLSEIPLTTLSYPTCNSLYKPIFPNKLPPGNPLPPLF